MVSVMVEVLPGDGTGAGVGVQLDPDRRRNHPISGVFPILSAPPGSARGGDPDVSSAGQRVPRLVDGVPDRLGQQRYVADDGDHGDVTGSQFDLDGSDTVDPADLLGHRGHALVAGHPGHSISCGATAHRAPPDDMPFPASAPAVCQPSAPASVFRVARHTPPCADLPMCTFRSVRKVWMRQVGGSVRDGRCRVAWSGNPTRISTRSRPMTVAAQSTPAAEGTAPRPQDDLFRHVNGHWLATAEIPADRSADGAFYQLRDKAEVDSRAIIEDAAAESAAKDAGTEPDDTARLIGDLYHSFMDVETVERLGLAPITEQLRVVDGVDGPAALMRTLGRLRRAGISGAFRIDVDTDPGDPDRYVLNMYQGGLGLPDESYYRDPAYADTLGAYSRFLPGMLELLAVEDAPARAEAAVELETALAAGHWDRVRSRDSTQTYNPMDRAGLDALLPGHLWDAWLEGLGADASVLDRVIVRQPDFFTALAALLTADRMPAWRAWLAWQIVRSLAPLGPAALVDKNFDFYGRTLTGTPELRERWKRGVSFVEAAVDEAVGRLYVQRHFPPEAKARMDELVNNLLAAYRREIRRLPWMGEETRARALDKLDAFTPKIGYPVRWRDYSA